MEKEETPKADSPTPTDTQAEASPETTPAAEVDSGEGGPTAEQQTTAEETSESQPNDDVRYEYWQSEATKAQNEVKGLQEQLKQGMTQEEREQFQRQATTNQLQNELIDTQVSSGHWEKQYPELKYLSRARLESVVRSAYQSHPDNPAAVKEAISQTAAGAREIAQSVEREVGPETAPKDAPAQAKVTPNPDYEGMAPEELQKRVRSMPMKEHGKLMERIYGKAR